MEGRGIPADKFGTLIYNPQAVLLRFDKRFRMVSHQWVQ